MASAFKQRIVGAIFILSLGVILIPVVLDTPMEDVPEHYSAKPDAPPLPKISDVAKINYVFNDMGNSPQKEPEVAAQPELAAAEPEKPTPAQPIAQEKPKTPPTPLVAQATKPRVLGDWTIQLGAFSSSENAHELMGRLSKEGFQSYLKETPGGRHLVRVYVAPGVDKDQAQALLTKLDSQFGIKGILVRYREE